MGSLEHDHNHRGGVPECGGAVLRIQLALVILSRTSGRQRSVGCVDVGMAYIVPTAGVQLCGHSGSEEPASALGHQASGVSGLEVRCMLLDSSHIYSRPSIVIPHPA